MKPYIVTCGTNGRCVVFGWSKTKPRSGKPCTLKRARMVLRWSAECSGLFGLAADGPKGDTRLSPPVAETETSPIAQVLAVGDGSGFDSWT